MKIPKRKETILRHAKQMEKQLKSEKQRYGCYDDGAGIRYFIGSYYLFANDVDGALKHYKWFKRVFPDDCGEPGQYLSWTYALYKSGDLKKAFNKFLQTLLMNPYVITRILKIDFTLPFKWSNNMMSEEWAGYIPDEIYNLWNDEDVAWLSESYNREETHDVFKQYCDIEKQLENEPVGPKRSKLVKKLFALRCIEI